MASRPGFLYCGRVLLQSKVSKIGLTTSRDPAAYVRRRYAGILDLENLIQLIDCDNGEKVVHNIFKDFRYRKDRSRELFYSLNPLDVQEAFQYAASLVTNQQALAEYFAQNGLEMVGESTRKATCCKPYYDEED